MPTTIDVTTRYYTKIVFIAHMQNLCIFLALERQKIIFEVCRDCMKSPFLCQINACVCLDQYEEVEGLLYNGFHMFFIRYTPTILRGNQFAF